MLSKIQILIYFLIKIDLQKLGFVHYKNFLFLKHHSALLLTTSSEVKLMNAFKLKLYI